MLYVIASFPSLCGTLLAHVLTTEPPYAEHSDDTDVIKTAPRAQTAGGNEMTLFFTYTFSGRSVAVS